MQQSSFKDYPPLQLNEMPEVEVHIAEDNQSALRTYSLNRYCK